MLRFGKTLGTLDREVSEIELMNSADPEIFETILNNDEIFNKDKHLESIIEKLFHK
jgi:hypothetical protein